jgi:hypothetical protein
MAERERDEKRNDELGDPKLSATGCRREDFPERVNVRHSPLRPDSARWYCMPPVAPEVKACRAAARGG